jgi:hypothetical protein
MLADAGPPGAKRHKPPVENTFAKSNVNIDASSSVQIDKCVLRFWY